VLAAPAIRKTAGATHKKRNLQNHSESLTHCVFVEVGAAHVVQSSPIKQPHRLAGILITDAEHAAIADTVRQHAQVLF
jgi:hypothetical protein